MQNTTKQTWSFTIYVKEIISKNGQTYKVASFKDEKTNTYFDVRFKENDLTKLPKGYYEVTANEEDMSVVAGREVEGKYYYPTIWVNKSASIIRKQSLHDINDNKKHDIFSKLFS